jgi:hypothetical protein
MSKLINALPENAHASTARSSSGSEAVGHGAIELVPLAVRCVTLTELPQTSPAIFPPGKVGFRCTLGAALEGLPEPLQGSLLLAAWPLPGYATIAEMPNIGSPVSLDYSPILDDPSCGRASSGLPCGQLGRQMRCSGRNGAFQPGRSCRLCSQSRGAFPRLMKQSRALVSSHQRP